ncbi:flagellar filament capping protein FliD [Photobacterium ganghwense]|uniref:flagellar filament capping protein FliD n=1 Tax=Photobacterium ganghwense TaxID=320778 RepID=UPI004055F032
MAGLTFSGIGTGMDVKGMTQQLVYAEKAPKAERINNEKSKNTISLSSYGQISSSASALQDLFEKQFKDKVFEQKTAKSSESDYISVKAEAGMQNGNYSIEVKQLAKSHKIATGFTFDADPEANLGTGDLVISVGDKSMTVSVAEDSNSLKDVVKAINRSDDNPGVTASIVTDDEGARIVFNANDTGSENKITIDASGMSGELARLNFDPADVASSELVEQVAAQDAKIVIDGFANVTSSTNTFEDAIEGVTLDVKKVTGTVDDDIDVKNVDITIGNDTNSVKTAIKDFVSKYNSLAATIDLQTKYNAETKKAAPLIGDSIPRSLSSQMRNLMNTPIESGNKLISLSEFGVTTDRDGRLEIDDDMLDDAVEDNFAAFSAFFMGDEGFLKQADEVLEGFVGKEGSITSRETSLKDQQTKLEDDLALLDERMKAFEERTYKQLTAMDEAIYKMNNELSAMMSMMVF